MKTILAGFMSVFFALIGYSIYEWINKRWFKRKDFLQIAAGFKFSPEVSEFLWRTSKGKIRQLITIDKKGEPRLAAGFEMIGISDLIYRDIREGLYEGYIAFITDFDRKKRNLGIVKGNDKFSILKIMQTNGQKYLLGNSKLINELKGLDKKAPFSILGAGHNWVELEFESQTEDISLIMEKANELCPPEILDMEVSPIEDELRTTNKIFLWWPEDNQDEHKVELQSNADQNS
jgi:hypothetical protein